MDDWVVERRALLYLSSVSDSDHGSGNDLTRLHTNLSEEEFEDDSYTQKYFYVFRISCNQNIVPSFACSIHAILYLCPLFPNSHQSAAHYV